MAGPGRDTELPEVRADLLKHIAEGLPRTTACALVGVTDRTLRRWVARGKAGESPFKSFLSDLKKAESQAIADRVKCIKVAMDKGNWQAAAWLLERLHYELFGDQSKEFAKLKKLFAQFLKGKK